MFNIKFLCPRWGFESILWQDFLISVKEAGYSGIEWFPNAEIDDYNKVLKLLRKYELDFSIVMAVMKPFKDFDDYMISLKNDLSRLTKIKNKYKNPLFITAQTGREFFDKNQVLSCIETCNKIQVESGIPIYHETHRNKWAYAAYKVYPVLKKNKNVLLTLDISHWFCVSESYLKDQEVFVNEAIAHARHIHARVGNIESAQVWDPAHEDYKEALNAHLKIWDTWVCQRRNTGENFCTITPEFGPPPYLVRGDRNISLTGEQWRLNLWMKSFLQQRYKDL